MSCHNLHQHGKPVNLSCMHISPLTNLEGRFYLKISKTSTHTKQDAYMYIYIHRKNNNMLYALHKLIYNIDSLHNNINIKHILPKLKTLHN